MTFSLGRTEITVRRTPGKPRRTAADIDRALQARIQASRAWLYRRNT